MGGAAGAMNWLDFLILALLAWFTLTAYLAGLIRESVGLAAVVLGVILAGLFHDDVAASLDPFLTNDTAARIVAFLTIFAIAVIAGWVASLFLRTVSNLLFLGWADHAAGALFGFFKAVLIIQAVTVIFVLQPALGVDTVIAESTIGSFFLDTTPFVRALLPGAFDEALRQFSG